MIQKYFAELLGTFLLTSAVIVSFMPGAPLPTPLMAGAMLGLVVYILGSVSGAHINPAITIGAFSVNKIKINDAIAYIIFQFAGAWIALLLAGSYFHSNLSLHPGNTIAIVAAEALGTFVLALAVSSVVGKKVEPAAGGITIGGGLALGAALASMASNGVLNPAVALGIGSFSWAYLIGPIIGSLAGFWLYRWLIE